MNNMQPKAEKLLRKVMCKCVGNSTSVDSFLGSIENIQQIGDSDDIAFTAVVLDSIEQSIPVMQDYLDDDSVTEIYEDMPVGHVLQAILDVWKMDTVLMTGRMKKLAPIKACLDNVIAVLQHAEIK